MTVSEMTVTHIASYLRLETGEYDSTFLTAILGAAKSYIIGYTGLDQEDIDDKEEFCIAVYVLCQDMYDNRTMYVGKYTDTNKLVEGILAMHSINYL